MQFTQNISLLLVWRLRASTVGTLVARNPKQLHEQTNSDFGRTRSFAKGEFFSLRLPLTRFQEGNSILAASAPAAYSFIAPAAPHIGSLRAKNDPPPLELGCSEQSSPRDDFSPVLMHRSLSLNHSAPQTSFMIDALSRSAEETLAFEMAEDLVSSDDDDTGTSVQFTEPNWVQRLQTSSSRRPGARRLSDVSADDWQTMVASSSSPTIIDLMQRSRSSSSAEPMSLASSRSSANDTPVGSARSPVMAHSSRVVSIDKAEKPIANQSPQTNVSALSSALRRRSSGGSSGQP